MVFAGDGCCCAIARTVPSSKINVITARSEGFMTPPVSLGTY
jgi:hypothetical protein